MNRKDVEILFKKQRTKKKKKQIKETLYNWWIEETLKFCLKNKKWKSWPKKHHIMLKLCQLW